MEGRIVGCDDGSGVGILVGEGLGTSVGSGDGCGEGTCVGCGLGTSVGRGVEVGMEVGANVGRLVGSSVGTGVGGRVYSTMIVEADVFVAFKSGEAFWKSVALVPFCLFASAVKLFAKLPLSTEAANVPDSDVAMSSAVPL